MWMLTAIKRLFERLAAEAGEEKAKAIIAEAVADINAEAQKLLENPSQLADVVSDWEPEDVVDVLVGVAAWLEDKVQDGVDRLWDKVEDINPHDEAGPAPDVDLDGDGE